MKSHWVPDALLSTIDTSFYLVLTTAIGYCHNHHFADKETEAWRGGGIQVNLFSKPKPLTTELGCLATLARTQSAHYHRVRNFQPEELTLGMKQEAGALGLTLDPGFRGVFPARPGKNLHPCSQTSLLGQLTWKGPRRGQKPG